MQKGQGIRLRCIWMALFFLIGILGSSMDAKSVSPRHAMTEAGSQAQIEGVTKPGAQAQWKPVGSLHGMDDFHTLSDAGGVSAMAQNAVRAAPLLFLAAVLIFLAGILWAMRRLQFGEKKISVFCVVSFLHRTDGKKKPCFYGRIKHKNRRDFDGNRNKIQSAVN